VTATGITVFLALVGKSRPGTFLKATAYISAADISISALNAYGRSEVNRAVFKLDNVDPKPGKLWERTKHWTTDDVAIGGSILGAFLALNPRALPGVRGWKRLLGAATVGAAFSGYVGQKSFIRIPAPLLPMMIETEHQIRNSQYDRLLQDAKDQEALSRVGRVALAFYTWPIFRLPINPFQARSKPGADGLPGDTTSDPHVEITPQEMDKYALVQMEFNYGELQGPDLEDGFRAYKDSLIDRDPSALQDRLENLQKLRKEASTETQYVWWHLATKEHEFYNLQMDDEEKDLVRRELQMLNNLAFNFALRDVIFAYHIADVHKRLEQIHQKEPVSQNLMFDSSFMQAELPEDWKSRHNPQIVTEQVRNTWRRQKQLLSILEEQAILLVQLKPKPGTPHDMQFKQVREKIGYMKKNVEATERLLKDFEEKLLRADEYVEKSTKPVDS
jgi:hypothetical protein